MKLGKALSTGIAEERPALHEEPVPEQTAPVAVPEPERPAQDRPVEVTAAR